MSFKTFAGGFNGAFWRHGPLTEDLEKNSQIYQNYLVALSTQIFEKILILGGSIPLPHPDVEEYYHILFRLQFSFMIPSTAIISRHNFRKIKHHLQMAPEIVQGPNLKKVIHPFPLGSKNIA